MHCHFLHLLNGMSHNGRGAEGKKRVGRGIHDHVIGYVVHKRRFCANALDILPGHVWSHPDVPGLAIRCASSNKSTLATAESGPDEQTHHAPLRACKTIRAYPKTGSTGFQPVMEQPRWL